MYVQNKINIDFLCIYKYIITLRCSISFYIVHVTFTIFLHSETSIIPFPFRSWSFLMHSSISCKKARNNISVTNLFRFFLYATGFFLWKWRPISNPTLFGTTIIPSGCPTSPQTMARIWTHELGDLSASGVHAVPLYHSSFN